MARSEEGGSDEYKLDPRISETIDKYCDEKAEIAQNLSIEGEQESTIRNMLVSKQKVISSTKISDSPLDNSRNLKHPDFEATAKFSNNSEKKSSSRSRTAAVSVENSSVSRHQLKMRQLREAHYQREIDSPLTKHADSKETYPGSSQITLMTNDISQLQTRIKDLESKIQTNPSVTDSALKSRRSSLSKRDQLSREKAREINEKREFMKQKLSNFDLNNSMSEQASFSRRNKF